ncbi:hypothetical protein [Ruminococcus albus]|uniref:Uncharacterized protein n=1 Tax=Ruminococcus albus (strain ATCC 27210 / DSM 20455 / JCM 14654 / NCDO 2250 / 7) TaxID=697329 RepID=E6UKQ8_RUMA7|nr:hypothetical protein [Ruminococcus albus]ADU24254.1 hypothetical protein Rumal_3824 [Ruminococcus albus 7 = DSM 20455]
MNKAKTPNEQPDNLVYLKETPAERTLFGFLTILIGLGIFGCVAITLVGISRSGNMSFFARMKNTVRSWNSDYYDIRTDAPEKDTIIIGTPLRKTTPDVRRITADLHEDSSCGSFMPGSYGMAKVYIIPHNKNAELTVDLSFNVYGLVKTADGQYIRIDELENDLPEQEKCSKADKLLNGHILFFMEKENGYSGLLKDGRMTYNTAEHQEDLNANGEYEVTVYWVWAEYFEQLSSINAEGAVIKDVSESETVKEYINSRPDEFFLKGAGESVSEMLNDQYDNADLLIHQNIDGYGFEIIANN